MKRLCVIIVSVLFLCAVACVQHYAYASHLQDSSGARQAYTDAVTDVNLAIWASIGTGASLAAAINSKNPRLIAAAVITHGAALAYLQTMRERRDRKLDAYNDCIDANTNKCPGDCCDSYKGFCDCVMRAGFPPPYRCPCFPPGSNY